MDKANGMGGRGAALAVALAHGWGGLVLRLDARALMALVALGGSLAWFLPWGALGLFLPLAGLSAAAAYVMLPGGRKIIAAVVVFTAFWALSFFLLQLWEHWGEAGFALSALFGALVFGGRLLAVFGLTLLVPLCLSPVTAGRVLGWYLALPAPLLPARLRPRLTWAAWQAALGLTLMAALLPRSLAALKALRQSLKLRAPQLPLHRRLWLLGLGALRLLGAQSWDMALSIAARDLYRAGPWSWRKPVSL